VMSGWTGADAPGMPINNRRLRPRAKSQRPLLSSLR
jgi:hypothetical protein